MQYGQFKYLYPPRPEVKTSEADLNRYDNGEYIAQPKYNGSCCVVFTNGQEVHVYNRHKKELAKYSPTIEFRKLARTSDWYVYVGEYLNKGKLGEHNEKEADKFIIWDILVWEGKYLIGQTLTDRLELLEKIHPCRRLVVHPDKLEMYEYLCCTEFKGIYKAPAYMNNFAALYRDIIKTDLYEGIVLKKRDSRLTYGFQELNNNDWQIKCRKETKLYQF